MWRGRLFVICLISAILFSAQFTALMVLSRVYPLAYTFRLRSSGGISVGFIVASLVLFFPRRPRFALILPWYFLFLGVFLFFSALLSKGLSSGQLLVQGIGLLLAIASYLKLTRFSGHLQSLDRDSRQEVGDEAKRSERL